MEVELTASTEFDRTHPNYERWKRAREISLERGKFVKTVVSGLVDCENLKVLDIGSGEGGTVNILSKDNFVVSLERNERRLKKQINLHSTHLVSGDAISLPFKQIKFDVIILQDCIEHLNLKNDFVDQLNQLLNENGIIYISTPNRNSIFNIISDPHWGLPIVSLLCREKIKKYFLKYFRKKDFLRSDIAELSSLQELDKIFGQKFKFYLNTKHAITELMNGNKGLVWSNFHLRLLKLAKKLHVERAIIKIANDRRGILNKFFTSTFYLILKKT